jgi:hypothetical protein
MTEHSSLEAPTNSPTAPQEVPASPEYVAAAGRYYRNARYLLTLIMFGMGLWFAYDGFVNWPAEQARFAAMTPRQQAQATRPHTDMDILIQRGLAIVLIPLAPLLLAWFLHRSRGEIRLSNNTLLAPGHPPVPLDAIRQLDMGSWERKGIAYVEYEAPGSSRAGRITLDEFVYQCDPIRAIVAHIEAWLAPAEQPSDQQQQPMQENGPSVE